MNRMYRCHALVLALFLCVHGPAAAETGETTGEGQAQTTAPPARQTTKIGKAVALPGKNGRPARGVRQVPSDFVHLVSLIVDNEFAFNSFTDFGINAFDPTIVDRTLVTRETRWAFGRIDTDSHGGALRPAAVDNRTPSPDPEPLHPFFGDVFGSGDRSRLLAAEERTPFGGIVRPDPVLLPTRDEPTSGITESGTDFTVGPSRPPLAYRYAMDRQTTVNAGVAWIHNLGDTTGMAKALEDPEGEGASTTRVSGVNLSLGARFKAVTLTGGYIRALDNRTSTELALEGKESDPIAWNSEIAYSMELLRRETTLAVGYQRSSEALQDYLPEERYRTRASMALSDSTIFSLEYYQDREYLTRNGEENGYGITTRIGFGF